MTKILLIIDMLNDFVRPDGTLSILGAQEIIPTIALLAREFRLRGLPVVYLCDAHAPEDPEFAEWPAHAIRGTRGAEVVSELTPEAGDTVVEKVFINVFREPQLARTLTSLAATELLICGVATEHCVRTAALGGLDAGYQVDVILDAIAAVEAEAGDADAALEVMRAAGARMLNSEEALAELATS